MGKDGRMVSGLRVAGVGTSPHCCAAPSPSPLPDVLLETAVSGTELWRLRWWGPVPAHRSVQCGAPGVPLPEDRQIPVSASWLRSLGFLMRDIVK